MAVRKNLFRMHGERATAVRPAGDCLPDTNRIKGRLRTVLRRITAKICIYLCAIRIYARRRMDSPAGRWVRGVQGNLGHLRLPSVRTYPADLWDRALHRLPGVPKRKRVKNREIQLAKFNFLCYRCFSLQLTNCNMQLQVNAC